MIVYRTQQHHAAPAHLLVDIRTALHQLAPYDRLSHAHAVELLLAFGELATAVLDTLSAEHDVDGPTVQALHRASLVCGRAFYYSWTNGAGAANPWLRSVRDALDRVASLPLPETVQVRVPEGYMHYGLYPETYLEAARQFFREVRPLHAICLGIRSIGTSLAAVVGATLAEYGCEVWLYTVRPRGHPFARYLTLSGRLEEALRALTGAYFLIIDEGPGLSGSSFASVTQRLADLGVADGRVVLFPSWQPDGKNFLSIAAQERWHRHKKYTVSFEDVWLASGRLTRTLPACTLRDLSGGKWRALFYSSLADAPAAQPHHERRKYLCVEDPSSLTQRADQASSATGLLLKFAGLGRYGTAKLARAEQLSQAGFAPPVLDLVHGFLITPFLPGRPVVVQDVNRQLLGTLARYLAYLQQTFPATRPVPYTELLEMIHVNTAEGLGAPWAEKLDWLKTLRSAVYRSSTVAIDGRMLPHEWLVTPGGYVKTDGLDHHDDHFFPGCQDIAWDLAGSCVEFGLGREAQAYLISAYQAIVPDKSVMQRLQFYVIAYLSYRLGYVTLAARALGACDDTEKFTALATHYTSLLRRAICHCAG